ncbi:MAG: dihydrodipicolinate synthase family protein [Thermoplasmata archaeon]|nr:dihydrodipicolinate synthase family protein [Thermoplasmata archaeon]
MVIFHGIITPMITPVKNNEIDFPALEKLLNYLEKIKVEGIFPGSSTGAFTLFSFEKHKRILEFSKENYKSNGTFLAGISRNNLEETISVGKFAENIGSDGVVIITPYYLKYDDSSLYNYYSKIAKSIDIPIFLYNNPELSCNSISAEIMEKLMTEFSNILGIKDSSGDMKKFNLYLSHLPKGRYIFQGKDELLYESLILGASGGVCGTSNFSSIVHDIYLKRDLELHKKFLHVIEILRNFKNNVSYNYIFRKKVLDEKNPENYSMEPFNDLNEKEETLLDNLIEKLKEYEH